MLLITWCSYITNAEITISMAYNILKSLTFWKDGIRSLPTSGNRWLQSPASGTRSNLQTVAAVFGLRWADKTSDWSLHLHCVSQMLNLLAAAGHNNYAKCTRLYLQQIVELPKKKRLIHGQLSSDNHTIRRTDRHWAAISTDLAIEQVMMRSMKSRWFDTWKGNDTQCLSDVGLVIYLICQCK